MQSVALLPNMPVVKAQCIVTEVYVLNLIHAAKQMISTKAYGEVALLTVVPQHCTNYIVCVCDTSGLA